MNSAAPIEHQNDEAHHEFTQCSAGESNPCSTCDSKLCSTSDSNLCLTEDSNSCSTLDPYPRSTGIARDDEKLSPPPVEVIRYRDYGYSVNHELFSTPPIATVTEPPGRTDTSPPLPPPPSAGLAAPTLTESPSIPTGDWEDVDEADEEAEIGRRAVAIYPFKPEHENEFELCEGQIVWVVYRHGQGWLVAEDPETGSSGLVPEEYVRILTQQEEDEFVKGV